MTQDRIEAKIIGAALRDPAYVLGLAERLAMGPEWFELSTERAIWSVISHLFQVGVSPEPDLVASEVGKLGYHVSCEQVRAYVDVAPSDLSVLEVIIPECRQKWLVRTFREEVDAAEARLKAEPADSVLSDLAFYLLNSVRLPDRNDADTAIEKLKNEFHDALHGKCHGCPMPWGGLFESTGGVEPGHVCVVVAHGNTGKSAFMSQWALYCAVHGWPAIYFPLEDSPAVTYRRLAGMLTGVNTLNVRLGKVSKKEVDLLCKALDKLREYQLIVSGVTGRIEDIHNAAQYAVMTRGVKIVYVDAIKDIVCSASGTDGENMVMGGLVRMAQQLNVPVVVAHHVRKQSTQVKGTVDAWRINRDDLRGSARIWDSSRLVIALQKYPTNKDETSFDYYWQVLKSNHGVSGVKKRMHFDSSLVWREMSDDGTLHDWMKPLTVTSC